MVLKAVYGSVNRNLMHFIHPIFGNPVFQCGFVFVFGGFFTFSSNAAKLEAQAFDDIAKDHKSDDKMGAHRAFMKRDSIVQHLQNSEAMKQQGLRLPQDLPNSEDTKLMANIPVSNGVKEHKVFE